ncbi:APC family permease [Clostridium estertheticum]|uniref:Amino acid permease n=1 Tax=Clostridium estertheticum subsp. estertheticum TaxID=1552 RepID=A0A1J0GCF4_9CLOT|nr:APC family permease [Clostridium estertheticum]APC39007.1 amino acid permease [Clostridium estertheticum subsp. estertheticum]MBU3074908.1 APC family permease [Clostridium estertheticum]MBU3165123.1 APC family permease [Clostridium estertheticum]MBU3174317.1 APC family permease [Clostridium estertheticum]MBU3183575.1 APC family permease [Clostridium estertheticum]
MFSKIRELLIGKTLKTEELEGEKLNVLWGLPILSSDAVSSVAYAGEEILIVLIGVMGFMAYRYMFYAALCIVLLLLILVFSYMQTIDSYPSGGGSYIVAKDNLGITPGLTAGAALTVGYVLTVAVSISAGTAAITSAMPFLYKYKVAIALIMLLIITIGNLRGTKESSKLFGVPTYIFIGSCVVLIVTGLVRHYVFGYSPQPLFSVPRQVGDITLFLFLRAFASGCSGLTGVEAVSNGIPNFKEPSQKNAKIVLLLLGGLVFFIFVGLSFLATIYHAVPVNHMTVLAQITQQVFGKNIFFYVIQFTTAIILIMAANTSYAGLPLLLSLMGNDGYVPRQFSQRGKRLSFSNGIIVLAVASAILIIVFKGDTHALLPLYAVGVFISFTLSQVGMFLKWKREKSLGWKFKAAVNGFGAVITFITVILIGIIKFTQGAWIVCIILPMLVYFMLKIKEHYTHVVEQIRLTNDLRPKASAVTNNDQHVIILLGTLNKSFLKALNCAKCLSQNVVAFHVSTDPEITQKLKRKWKEYNPGIPLIIEHSSYRDVMEPLMNFIQSEERSSKHGETVTVVLTQFVITKWWHNLLHNQTGYFIKSQLYKNRNVAVLTVPYIIKE